MYNKISHIDSRELAEILDRSHDKITNRIIAFENYYSYMSHSDKWERFDDGFKVTYYGAMILIGDSPRSKNAEEMLDMLNGLSIRSEARKDFTNSLIRILNGAKLDYALEKKCSISNVDFYIPKLRLAIDYLDIGEKYQDTKAKKELVESILDCTYISVDYSNHSFTNLGGIIGYILETNGII